MPVLRLPISESKHSIESAFGMLGKRSRSLLATVAGIYHRTNRNRVSLDDIRIIGGFGNWREILDSFFELESRQLGKVRSDGAEVEFTGFIPVLQSINA